MKVIKPPSLSLFFFLLSYSFEGLKLKTHEALLYQLISLTMISLIIIVF